MVEGAENDDRVITLVTSEGEKVEVSYKIIKRCKLIARICEEGGEEEDQEDIPLKDVKKATL